MYEYLQICVLLSCAFAATLSLLKTAPARLKLIVSALAMTIWLIPWSAFDVELPHAVASPFESLRLPSLQQAPTPKTPLASANGTFNRAESTESPPTAAESATASLATVIQDLLPTEQTLLNVFGLLSGLGILLWLNHLTGYLRARKYWQKHATDANDLKQVFSVIPERAYVKYCSCAGPGMTSGLLKPTIWIRPDIKDPDLLATLVTHESVHVRHYDYVWCWGITLLENVFWWNPFVKLFTSKAKAYIELSCDEAASKLIPKETYRHALIKILCQEQSPHLDPMVVGIGSGLSLDFLRTKELTIVKKLKTNHVSFVMAGLMVSLSLALLLAHDSRYADIFADSHSNQDQLKALSHIDSYETFIENSPLYRFNEAVIRQDVRYTSQHADALINQLFTAPDEDKILGFRILAMYFSEQQDFESLVQLGDRLISPNWRQSDKFVNRIYAITYIKLGRYDEAIDLLTATRYMGLVNFLLNAQAHHLKGDYEKSNHILEDILDNQHRALFPSIKSYTYRLYGKNLTLLNKHERLASVNQTLGSHAPKNYLEVRADKQRIPYVYSLKQFVNGVRIEGFDADRFPLETTSVGSLDYSIQKSLSDALQASTEQGGITSAIHILSAALANSSTADQQSQTAIIEHLLLLYIRQGDMSKAKATSMQLLELGQASESMRARALWILSRGRQREQQKNSAYFDAYMDLYQGQLSIAADHEIIKRFPNLKNKHLAEESLTRVAAFYEQQGLVPDIKVLNKMIGLYKAKGQTDKALLLEKNYRKAYPYALNYIFE